MLLLTLLVLLSIPITVLICIKQNLTKVSKDIKISETVTVKIRSSAGNGTHIYLKIPGRNNGISIDCGAEIVEKGISLLGNHIFITHTHMDHIAALISSILNARRPGTTYNIYVPASKDNAILKNMVNWINSTKVLSFDNLGTCENSDKSVTIKLASRTIIIREAIGSIVISNNNYFMKATPSLHSIDSVAYTLYVATGSKKNESLPLHGAYLNNFYYRPLATFSGDTTSQLWEDNKHLGMSEYIFAECTRFTGDPEDAHKNMHTHITDLEKYSNTWEGQPILYHISARENIHDIESAINKYLPDAVYVYEKI